MSFLLPLRSKPNPPPNPSPTSDLDREYEHILAQLSAPDWADTPEAITWFHDLRTTVTSLLTRLIAISEEAITQYEQTNTHHHNNRYQRLTTSVMLLRNWLEREFLPEMRMTKWFLRAVDDVLMVRATEVQYDIEYWMGDARERGVGVVEEGHVVAGLVQDAVIKLGEKREGSGALKDAEMFLALPEKDQGEEDEDEDEDEGEDDEEMSETETETETETEIKDEVMSTLTAAA